MTNVVCSSKGTDVNIGNLGDAKTIEDFGQVRQTDTLTNNFHIPPTIEKPVAGRPEARGTYKHRGLLKEPATCRRGRVERDRLGITAACLHSLARFTKQPHRGAGGAVYRPEDNH